jgi:hypothetical protein
MQWPPHPVLGQNGMNPKGFVAAASIASHMSTCQSCEYSASSLTRPMLTCRKVFSISFDISASRVPETVTTLGTTLEYRSAAAFAADSSAPPTTLAMSSKR